MLPGSDRSCTVPSPLLASGAGNDALPAGRKVHSASYDTRWRRRSPFANDHSSSGVPSSAVLSAATRFCPRRSTDDHPRFSSIAASAGGA